VMCTGKGPIAPGWEAHPLELEDLVIAYLEPTPSEEDALTATEVPT
jgi:hypothetical protein